MVACEVLVRGFISLLFSLAAGVVLKLMSLAGMLFGSVLLAGTWDCLEFSLAAFILLGLASSWVGLGFSSASIVSKTCQLFSLAPLQLS